MKRIKTRTAVLTAVSWVVALACGSGGGSTTLDANQAALTSANGAAEADEDAEEDDDDEGGADKVFCAVDADCDADEVCSNGRCADPPGVVDDEDDDDDDDVCGDDDDGEEDDDGPGDKILCAVDADCDADEVCSNGLCSDP